MSWRFLPADADLSSVVGGQYEPGLVVLSILLAILASWAALQVVDQVRVTRLSRLRAYWVVLGAICLGAGVWSMHFIGMLGFILPVPVRYDVQLTLLSILPAIFASLLALSVLAFRSDRLSSLVVSGVLIAAGIGSMHYLGMEAMHAQGLTMWYDMVSFAASLATAIVLGIAALLTKARLAPRLGGSLKNLLSGVVLGFAVSGMHYVAMSTTWFLPGSGSVNRGGESIDAIILGIIVTGIVIGLVLIVVVSLIVSWRLREVDVGAGFLLLPVTVLVLSAALVLVSFTVTQNLKRQSEIEVRQSLETILSTTHQALIAWHGRHIAAARILAASGILRDSFASLAPLANDPVLLQTAPAQGRLRPWYDDIQQWTEYRGFFLVSRDLLNLASSRDSNIGVRNLLAEEGFFDVIWQGRGNISSPVKSDVPLRSLSGKLAAEYPTMFVGVPVYSASGEILAALTFRIDLMQDFVPLLLRGQVGNTGETYAINREGYLVSESRFEQDLRKLGLLGESETSMLSIRVVDPGVNLMEGKLSFLSPGDQPLTLMAAEATRQRNGSNTRGYLNYRGVPVVGAWLWDERLNLGLTTEQNLDEAMSFYVDARNGIVILTGLIITVMFLLVFVSTLARLRQVESGRRTRAILDTAIDGVLTWNQPGTVETLNRAAQQILGASARQIRGRQLEGFIPALQGRSYEDVRDFFKVPDGEPLTFKMETDGRRMDGAEFPMDISVSETMLPSGKRLFTGIMRDVTERKRVEDELLAATRDRQKLDSELGIARSIQTSMLPSTFPPFPDQDRLDIHAVLKPATEVGGDFYNFFELPDGRIVFAIGDVSGKGIPASLFMALAKTLVESRANDDPSPGNVLTRVNADLSKRNDANMFVTLFLVLMDPVTGEFRYANAGHNPPFVMTDDGHLERLAQRHGPVVGALEGTVYGEDSYSLGQGDTLVMYTDGVTEAINDQGELFGEDRLQDTLRSLRFESTSEMITILSEQVDYFEGNQALQTDDITLLVVRRTHLHEASRVLVLELTLENRVEEIRRVNDNFAEVARIRGIEDGFIQRINIVFDELLSNIIFYCGEDQTSAHIRIRIEYQDDRVKATISNDGLPFNSLLTAAPDINQSLQDRSPGGLGLHIVKNLVDEITYHRRINQNVINLLKYID